jgi:hypothetical protein
MAPSPKSIIKENSERESNKFNVLKIKMPESLILNSKLNNSKLNRKLQLE